MKKTLLALSLIVGLSFSPLLPVSLAETQAIPTVAVKPTTTNNDSTQSDKAKGIIDGSYKDIQALNLLSDTDKWVGEKVSFEGTFVTFSPYALDYKPAMRASKDYIAFLIQRPDVQQHIIPLSELKLIYPRLKADKVQDIENGDKILVKGKVFSAALGDPWVDVDEIVLLQKSPENIAKEKKNPKKHH
jgi:hypothetical protein